MARRGNKGPQRPTNGPPADPQLLDIALATLRRGLDALDMCVTRVVEMLQTVGEDGQPAKYDSKMASHLTWMVQQQASVVGELRLLENHDRATLAKLTPAQRHANVLTYIEHEMPAAARADLRALLERLDATEKLLS